MNTNKAFKIYTFLVCLLLLGACKNSWEDHIAPSQVSGTKTLLDEIAAQPNLSQFYAYLKQTGLDSSLASSKTYTVWAPDNKAIETFMTNNPDYLTNPEVLKQFLKYHIATLLHPFQAGQPAMRVLTLTGLSVTVDAAHYEEAAITSSNQLAANGVLNIIDAALTVKQSVFGAAITLAAGKQQGLDMAALDTISTDSIGVTTLTRSSKWSSLVTRMSAADSLYTYFIVNDAAYNNELAKISPYYKSTKIRPDSTKDGLTKIAMLENYLVRGMYTSDQLPDTLTSVGGVKMAINKSAIVSSYKANNGMVYIMNELPIALKDRVKEFKIEGEQSSGRTFSRSDKSANIYYRTKLDSLGQPFNDIEIYDHKISGFYVQYKKASVQSATYNVYTRAVSNTVGDAQTVTYTQRYGIPDPVNPLNTQILFTQVVTPLHYSEVYLGRYTVTQQGTITIRLISAASTSTNVNTLILDYLRFVPILP